MIESSDPLRSWIPVSDLSFGRWKKGRPSCGNIVPAISQGRMQGPYYVYSSKVSQKRWISMVQWLTTGSFTQKPTSHKAVVFVFPPWIRGKAPTHATTNVSWSNTNIHHIWNLHGKHVKLLPTIHIFTYGQGLSGFCLQAFISFASRHLDLGLCRTFWIGWIHPVNFQSWPLEESIFPLSNYVIYDVIYIYIMSIFLFQSPWIFNLRPLPGLHQLSQDTTDGIQWYAITNLPQAFILQLAASEPAAWLLSLQRAETLNPSTWISM